MKKIFSSVVLTASVLAASGCASIMSGEQQQLSINSNVRGAKVEINGVEVGTTPFLGKVNKPKSGDANVITLSAPGYDTKKVNVATEIEPTFWVNVLTGGPFGSTTDYQTGSMYRLGNGSFDIPLEKLGK
jgi:hypothetical protein